MIDGRAIGATVGLVLLTLVVSACQDEADDGGRFFAPNATFEVTSMSGATEAVAGFEVLEERLGWEFVVPDSLPHGAMATRVRGVTGDELPLHARHLDIIFNTFTTSFGSGPSKVQPHMNVRTTSAGTEVGLGTAGESIEINGVEVTAVTSNSLVYTLGWESCGAFHVLSTAPEVEREVVAEIAAAFIEAC